MTCRGFAFLGLVLHAFSAVAARADVAVMVPPGAEQGATTNNDEPVEEISRLLKLRGFDVISAGQAGPAAEAEQGRGVFPRTYDPLFCITPECGNEYRKLFDALFAVQTSISFKAGRPASVTVVLVENQKSFFSATALVEGRDVRAAARAAFDAARAKQEDGAGPWLSVTGFPDAATIYIDDAEFGHTPFQKRRIEPGAHRFEARKEGYLSDQRALSIAGHIDHVENVVIALKSDARPEQAPVARRRRIRRSVWDWTVGGVVAAVGAAHLVAGVYQKSKDGDCAERQNGVCTEVYGSRGGASRDNLMIGLGAAGVVVGGLVMGLGPIGTLSMDASRERALLQLKGTF